MKCNVGKINQISKGCCRYINNWGWRLFQIIVGAIGIVPLVTASLGWRPAYLPLGVSTVNKKS